MTWKLHASYPQPAELLDKFFPTKSWFINGLSSSEAFEGRRTRRVWSHPAQCGVRQRRAPCAPSARGLPQLHWDSRLEIPTAASSTDTAASPTLAKGGQMDPGSSGLNGKPGTGRVCAALFAVPFVPNVCWNLLLISICYSQVFSFPLLFLGLPTCVTLRGSSSWCSQCDTKK